MSDMTVDSFSWIFLSIYSLMLIGHTAYHIDVFIRHSCAKQMVRIILLCVILSGLFYLTYKFRYVMMFVNMSMVMIMLVFLCVHFQWYVWYRDRFVRYLHACIKVCKPKTQKHQQQQYNVNVNQSPNVPISFGIQVGRSQIGIQRDDTSHDFV